jgi:hypothetical protein
MKRLLLILLMGMLLLPVSLQSPVAQAASEGEPLVLEGVLKGAPYRIVVPVDWNGTLLVYARGYSAVPVAEPEAAFLVEDQLLERGYALASSGLRSGGQRVDLFTLDLKYLTDFFKQQVGKPDYTVIYGISMGGVLTLLSMEKFPGTYDAGIPLCANGTGLVDILARRFSFSLAYDAAFGWDDSWGKVEDLRDDIEFWSEVWGPKVFDEILWHWMPGYPANYARWEFIRLVNDMPKDDYYYYPPVWRTAPGAAIANMYFSVHSRAELEVEAGGRVSQNVGYVYALSDEERAYLLNLDPTLNLDAMLAQMNAMSGIRAEPWALAHLRRVGSYSGRVHGPILMAHNVADGITPVEGTTVYADLMASARRQHLLTRVYSGIPGHCNFTADQMLALFEAMDGWLATGAAPGPEAFPEALDFVHDFEPGPWPQPLQE